MIFVVVGTNEAPFDRLLHAVEELPYDDVLVQCGSSRLRPRNARCVDFLPFDEVVQHVRDASAVISHVGVGTVLTVLRSGKTPVVVPRLRRFGEAVDDHQLEFGRRLAAEGLAVLVEDPAHLASQPLPPPAPASHPGGSPLAEELRAYVLEICGVEGIER